MFKDATYNVELTRSSTFAPNSRPSREDDDAISFVPSLSSVYPISDELKAQVLGASNIIGSLLPPALPSAHTSTPPATSGNPADHALQVTKAKEDEERRKWCVAYDAAQPTGRSLSAQGGEFQDMLRVFRESQPKKVKTEIIIAVEQPVMKEKKGVKKWLSGRKILRS